MSYKVRLYGRTYEFKDIREVMCKANELKSGDCLAGIAAEDTKERIAAKMALSNITVHDIRENPAVPYEQDSVTRIIQDDLNIPIYNEIKGMTISDLREWILDSRTTGDMILRAGRGMTSEVIAAVCKLMGNLDLMYAAKKIEIVTHCNTSDFRGQWLQDCSRTTPPMTPRALPHHCWRDFPMAWATL